MLEFHECSISILEMEFGNNFCTKILSVNTLKRCLSDKPFYGTSRQN